MLQEERILHEYIIWNFVIPISNNLTYLFGCSGLCLSLTLFFSLCVHLWTAPWASLVMPLSFYKALFQCRNILLREHITSQECHHVYSCLYVSTKSIFNQGLSSCQLLSSAVLPEGHNTHYPALADWSEWAVLCAIHWHSHVGPVCMA